MPLPSGSGRDLGDEVAIGAKRSAQERGQTLHVAGLGDHSVREEALAHQPHIEGHPARHELPEILLKAGGVVAWIGDRATQNLRPDGGGFRAGQRIRTDQIDLDERKRRGRPLAPDELNGRDLGEIAALELIRREKASAKLPLERINLVGPDTLTGADVAAIWSKVLKRPIAYGGDDTSAFEQNLRKFMPSWMAFDMRLMSERFLSDGMIPEAGDVERLTALLGRPLRSYHDFAAEIAASS
ncbi:MAG TPA: hypothetical protein VLJ83_01235 [Gemmatimonadaceae bacterium]|nr:hypothetical protein [Gemmatimonadaceae bacterium]